MDKSFYANFYAKLKTTENHTNSMGDHTNSTGDHTNSIDLFENYLNSTEKEYLNH